MGKFAGWTAAAVMILNCTACDPAILEAVNKCMETFYDGSCGGERRMTPPASGPVPAIDLTVSVRTRPASGTADSWHLIATQHPGCALPSLSTAVPANGTVSFSLAKCEGARLEVELRVADTCLVEGYNPRVLAIVSDKATAEFQVTCATTE